MRLSVPAPTGLARALLTAVLVLVLVTGCLLLAALAAVRGANPQATRPCLEEFAEGLWDDALLAEQAAGDVGLPQGGDGGCQDADGGGVSYAEQTRVTTASDEAVAAHFAAAASRLGWEHARVTHSRNPVDAYEGAGVCADRVVDGHTLAFNLVFAPQDGLAPGQRSYSVSLTGDPGDFPACLTG
jgi:hypothetical protein